MRVGAEFCNVAEGPMSDGSGGWLRREAGALWELARGGDEVEASGETLHLLGLRGDRELLRCSTGGSH